MSRWFVFKLEIFLIIYNSDIFSTSFVEKSCVIVFQYQSIGENITRSAKATNNIYRKFKEPAATFLYFVANGQLFYLRIILILN